MNKSMTQQEVLQLVRAATVAFVVMPEPHLQASANEAENRELPNIVGTGFALAEDPRIIVTAAHVAAGAVGKAAEASIRTGVTHQAGLMWEADFEGGDTEEITATYAATVGFEVNVRQGYDVAVVKLRDEAASPPAGLFLGDADDVQEGVRVATCGWPYGTQVHKAGEPVATSFAWGTVSNIMPHPQAAPDRRREYWIQMPVNPGNSGGALFDPRTGKVAGIIVSLLEVRGVRAGLAHAVPIELARAGIDGYLANQQG